MSNWEAQGQPWRSAPEITATRQQELTQQQTILADVSTDTYPFKGVVLGRADVEWLLATHRAGNWINEWYSANEGETKRGLDLRGAVLSDADLHRLPLYELLGGLDATTWFVSDECQREAASADLRRADLNRARLQSSSLRSAHLEGANLQYARLEGASLRGARLQGADLRYAYLDRGTGLNDVTLGDKMHGVVRVADTRWDDANLAVVNWSTINQLGDEIEARRRRTARGKNKRRPQRLDEFQAAVRANRQLASALRGQGMNEDADRFAYRAHILERRVLLQHLIGPASSFPLRNRRDQQRRWHRLVVLPFLLVAWLVTWPFRLHPWQRLQLIGAIFLSLAFGALSGHGYRPGRSLFAYVLVTTSFAVAFGVVAPAEHITLSPVAAAILSLTSFHGRGLFPGATPSPFIAQDDPLAIMAACEALIGLFIEVSLVATFSRRFFER